MEAIEMNRIKEIRTIEEWQEILTSSLAHPVLIFKHSTACPISAEAWREYQDFTQHAKADQVEAAIVKVIESRPISNQVAVDTGVKHASPQVMLIKQKKADWHTSHWDITAINISKALR
jgi:bacillithiol system protein YtxJ